MDYIYMDNAATSYPKAPKVSDAMKYYIDEVGASINRSSYPLAMSCGMKALTLRERACRLFNFDNISHVVITSGATMGLNMVIKGFLKENYKALISPLEHNSVMRPLNSIDIKAKNISYNEFDYPSCLNNDYSQLEDMLEDANALIMLHSSNVSGEVYDIYKIGEICKKKNIAFILDASQSAGHIEIDFKRANLSALAVPAHKGLLAPQGIGLLLMKEEFAKNTYPLIEGGTGSVSESFNMPTYMPDRFEAGTLNIPAIYGFEKSLEFIENVGIETINAHISSLYKGFIEGLYNIENKAYMNILGKEGARNSGIVSIDFLNIDNAVVSDILALEYGIYTRSGIHCAANAHKVLGSFPRGSVRFSLGYFNTKEQVDKTLSAIEKICKEYKN